MSKIVMYSGSTTGTTTTGDQYAFFINENGLPTIKKGSQVISFGTSGYAMQGSSGSSGANGTAGRSGTNGLSGTSGQDGAPGSQGLAGTAGSSGVSGSSGINGIDGLNGSSGVSGTNGVDGTFLGSSGSSGASLAKVNEDMIYTSGSGVIIVNSGQTLNSIAYFPQSEFGGLPLAFYQSVFNSPTDNTFSGIANNQGIYSPIQTFLNGKKLTSIKLNRVANSPSAPVSGRTECVTTAVNLLIYKGTIATSGSLSVSLVKTVDISTLINFNFSGETTTATIDLTADNIQTAHNEYIYIQINRSIEPVNTVSKYANSPGLNIFFETVTSGILGTNGTAGVSGTNGVSGSSGVSGTNGTSNGTSGVSGSAGSSGQTGSSGSSGAPGSAGVNGTSGTSAGGGGGVVEDTQLSYYVGPSAGQPTLTASRKQWHSVYGDGLSLDQGNGGAYVDQEYGFVLPITLHAGETLDTLGVYVNESVSTGTGEMKLMIMDKHPSAFLPNNIVQTNTLTWSLTGDGNKWVSWDMNFTHTGSTNAVYFVWQLFSSKATNPYDLCRTVIYPPYLTYDYRQVGGYQYDNRFDKTGHWMTQGTTCYSSIPANFLTIMSSGQFTYTNDRGGHFYYQTLRT